MEFRRLKKDELEAVEEDFIKFLAANSVTGPDWEKIKKEEPEKAEGLIDMFSEIFWRKVTSKIKFVKEQYPKMINVYSFSEDEAQMISFQTNNPDLDFSNQSLIESISKGEVDVRKMEIEMYQGKKSLVQEERSLEIFHLLEKGARPCEEVLFRAFRTLIG